MRCLPASTLILLLCIGEPIPTLSPAPVQLERQDPMEATDKFARTIQQIGREVTSLAVPDELFVPEAFRAIYEDPETYLVPAIALIKSEKASAHEKLIVGYAMQRLSVESFVNFSSVLMDSVEHGLADSKVLDSTAFAPFNWGKQVFIMNYQQPKVQTALTRLMGMAQVSEHRKAYVRDKVLTGEAKRDYLDYMDTIGRPVQE